MDSDRVRRPERLQIRNEFLKLNVAEYQVCTGLPFFELHKVNFVYHPNSEWCKFLDYLHRSRKFARIVCDGWELLIRPPLGDATHGFRSVRVHYRRKAVSPPPVSLTVPGGADLVASSYQHWASDPSASGAGMEVDSLEGPTDFTAKLSCQPKVKRSRVEGAFDGFRNTRTRAPSSSREKDLQAIVAMGSEKPKSISNCVTDVSYDISPTSFDHVSRPLASGSDNKWDSLVADKGKSLSIQGVFHQRVPKHSSNGNRSLGNAAALGATPGSDWMKKYVAEAAMLKPPSAGDTSAVEKCLQWGGSSQGVPNGVEAKVPEMVISDGATTLGAVPAKEDHWRNHVAEAAVVMLSLGASDISVADKCLQASGSSQAIPNEMKKALEVIGSHEATSGPASVNADWLQDALAKARSSGSDSGVMEKPSQASGSAEVWKEKAPERPLGKLKDRSNGVNAGAFKRENSRGPPCKRIPSDRIALQKSSQAKGKLKVVQSASSHDEASLPPSYINGDLTPQTGSQVADKGKAGSKRGPGVSLKKRVSKPSSNGNRKPVVRCIPCVPEAFRVNIKTSTEEQMSKSPSTASGAFQKQTCSQPEAELHGVKEKEPNINSTLLSSSFENSVKQKSLKDAMTINGDTSAPSSNSDGDSQQTCKSIAFTYGVTRSKPQKLRLKKSSTEGSLGAEVSASACDAKKEKNGWQQWLRVIHNILQFMYLAEERGATKVDVDVKEVYCSLGKRNVVAVTIADNGKGMLRREVEYFCSAIKNNLSTHLILLTQTETEKLVGIIYKNELWAILYPKHDEGVKNALDGVEAISPFNSALIMSEFLKIDRRGTRMIIYRHEELVFKQPMENVKVENLVQTTGQHEGGRQVTNDFDMTKIKKSLGEKLSAGTQYSCNYNLMIEKKEITLSISFKEKYSRFETYGIFLYHQNRLLEDCPIFWKVDQMFQDGNYGQGVVGVVDITCLMDCGYETQINFKHNKYYNTLMYKLADMVRYYCGNLDNVKNGGRKELRVCNSSKVNLSEKLYKVVGNGTTSDDPLGKKEEARDISKGKICDSLKEAIPGSLHLPKTGESSISKPMIRSKECWKLGKLPFSTETDNLSADWNCNMSPSNRSCGFPAEGTIMDEDDLVLLSELIRRTPNLAENNADGLENDETDYEPKDLNKEYEVEKILGTKMIGDQLYYHIKWVGCDMDGNPWNSTWEPADNVCNADQKIQEYFLRNS